MTQRLMTQRLMTQHLMTQHLMTMPGVGAVTALSFSAVIEDPPTSTERHDVTGSRTDDGKSYGPGWMVTVSPNGIEVTNVERLENPNSGHLPGMTAASTSQAAPSRHHSP
jgi:hypothetical protein